MTRRPRTVGAHGSQAGRERTPLLATILLVDPDEDARAMLRDALLEGAGPFALHSVASAGELDAYLEAAEERATESSATPPPTLVVIDLDLPDDEGLAAISRLKQDDATRRIPVVALTRGVDQFAVNAAYDAGANTILPRPVTFLALVRLMKVFTAYWLDAATLPEEHA
jgi:two-component system response regulator